MNREISTPNIVVDDNYRMLVKRLTRRYAERGASVYADAEAIESDECAIITLKESEEKTDAAIAAIGVAHLSKIRFL